MLRDVLSPGRAAPDPVDPLRRSTPYVLPIGLIVLLSASVMVVPLLGAGRSPHILYRPDELTMSFDDVRGSEGLVEEVTKTLNLFLAYRTFNEQMGGTPRKAILFEGPPGTGKTYMAKAMAAEAGVPFLFVSSSAFQSMFYGQTNRKIRSYFKELRRQARREGGAIGFIEELDAIGGARGARVQPGRGRARRGQRTAHPAPVLRADAVVGPHAGQGRRGGQRLAARRAPAAQADRRARQHPGHRGHQPGGRPGPGPDAARALRPHHLLRAARVARAARDILDYYLGKKAHEPSSTTRPARHAGRHDRRATRRSCSSTCSTRRWCGPCAAGRTGCPGTTSSRPR